MSSASGIGTQPVIQNKNPESKDDFFNYVQDLIIKTNQYVENRFPIQPGIEYIKPGESGLSRAVAICSSLEMDNVSGNESVTRKILILFNRGKLSDRKIFGGAKVVSSALDISGQVTREVYTYGIPIIDDDHEKKTQTELAILETLKGKKGFVQLIGHCSYISNDVKKYRVFVEKCSGGDLFESVRFDRETNQFSISETKRIFEFIVKYVSYLHNIAKVVHLDLKPENLFLEEKNGVLEPVIGDFGHSQFIGGDLTDRLLTGTHFYFSPERAQAYLEYQSEILVEDSTQPPLYKTNHNPKAIDIWQIGCILYYLLNQSLMPWCTRKMSPKEICNSIINSKTEEFCPLAKDERSPFFLLSLLFEKDPHKRINISDVETYLEKLDWDLLERERFRSPEEENKDNS